MSGFLSTWQNLTNLVGVPRIRTNPTDFTAFASSNKSLTLLLPAQLRGHQRHRRAKLQVADS
jgi:hypothetical protein